jgi:hypothetical protein
MASRVLLEGVLMTSPPQLNSLLLALIEIGGGLANKVVFPERRLPVEQQILHGIKQIQTMLDRGQEPLAAWFRRAETSGPTIAFRRILRSLSPSIHEILVGRAPRSYSASGVYFSIKLGQAAWDLCAELDKCEPPVSTRLKTALEQVWPERPRLDARCLAEQINGPTKNAAD